MLSIYAYFDKTSIPCDNKWKLCIYYTFFYKMKGENMSQKFQMMFQIAESSFEELPRVCRTPAYVKGLIKQFGTSRL